MSRSCNPAPLHVLGLGQDLTDLPSARQRLIQEAELIAAPQRIQAALPEIPAQRILLNAPLEPILERLAEEAARGRRVVVLVGGDPCFYGIGPLLFRRLGRERVVLHPGTTTLQAAAALLGLAWQDAAAVSLHGRDDDAPLYNSLARHEWVAVYTDETHTPASVARRMLERGVRDFAMWVFENLGLPGQRHGKFSLEQAREQTFARLNLVLLQRVQEPLIRLRLGTDDQAYVHERGMITKRMTRAAALAALRLEPENVLWDLGAGCGSVGIEAGLLLLPRGRVVAVEREERRAAMIRENVCRTHAFWVQTVRGAMPDCLPALPGPDRIFLGGGLGDAADGRRADGDRLLEAAWELLKPGGRMTASTVLLHSMHRVQTFLEHHGRDLEVIQLQAGHAVPLARDLRLCADNPVFLVCANKPGRA